MSPTGLSIAVPPTPPLTASNAAPIRTNSLVITNLPGTFFNPNVLDALRSYFAAFGDLYAWAPIKSFSRIVLVFYDDDNAESAKLTTDGLTLEGSDGHSNVTLRVYRADPTPLPSSSTSSPSEGAHVKFSPYHLRPPTVERNFLISPPGSPPVGWEPIREEPPNDTPLADDLIMALRRLQVSQENETHLNNAGVSVLIEPDEGPGVGVYVEDCGHDFGGDGDNRENKVGPEDAAYDGDGMYQDEGWFYSHEQGFGGHPQKFMSMHTMRPPMPTSA